MTALKLTIPTTLLNLTQRQLIFISRLFLMGYSETEFLIKAFLFLSNLKIVKSPGIGDDMYFKHKSIRKPTIIDTELLAQMAEKCRFLLDTEEVRPVRWINFARARHFRLYNATFGEYLMAENYYFAFVGTRKDEHLNKLMAVLYRRPWHRWNSDKIQSRAKQFAKVDPAVKNSVFMWYIGFRALVPKRCPNLFAGKKSSGDFNVRNYINGMIHQLSGGNITLNNQLMNQPVWNALDEMEQRALDAARLEEAYKNNK
ncbi:hypothetical protein [Mangrovibacterium sp.]|uniref:hypothetical protein n=1 Tax=Mangrovibacterium sp. TaxID=1961364 RepID=UPI003563A17A